MTIVPAKSSAPTATTTPSVVEQPAVAPQETQPLDPAALEERQREINAEIARLGRDHAWAGVYSSFHVDASTEIAVAPAAGYVVSSTTMARKPIVLACGRVRLIDETLALEPEFPSAGFWSLPSKLIPVRWGDCHDLLYENRLNIFRNQVNGARELPKASDFGLLRSGDTKLFGKPHLPAAYQALIFDEPLVAKVVNRFDGVRKDRAGNSYEVGVIVLDVGRKRGAFETMRLYRNAPGGNIAVVDTVHETTCEATYGVGPNAIAPEIGAELSTRRPPK